jgi:hypothetical protein
LRTVESTARHFWMCCAKQRRLSPFRSWLTELGIINPRVLQCDRPLDSGRVFSGLCRLKFGHTREITIVRISPSLQFLREQEVRKLSLTAGALRRVTLNLHIFPIKVASRQ